ncbi:WD40/YVTN/BNR-like repeat-containing protein [Ferruginibacter sp.]
MKRSALTGFAAVLFILSIFTSSCSKSNDVNTGPVTEAPDTLSAGWSKVSVTNEVLADVFFQNNSVGYALGKSLYKTTDGGNSWTKLNAKFSYYSNLAVTNDGKIFVAGGTDTIYRSADGGANFTFIKLAYTGIFDVLFIDNNNGYAPYSGGLLQTADGGVTWTPVSPVTGLNFTTSIYRTGSFISNTAAWIADGSNIFKANGNTNTWVKANLSGVPASTPASIYAASASVVYASFSTGQIFKSVDGGANFSQIANYGSNLSGFADLHFIDANNGYLSFGRKLFKTSDGGTTWQAVVSLATANFSEIHFTDATHGWACTSNGNIIKLN